MSILSSDKQHDDQNPFDTQGNQQAIKDFHEA